MVVATKPCSLLFDLYPRILCEASLEDCRLQVPFEFFIWNLHEASLIGFSHQVLHYLPNLSEESDPMYTKPQDKRLRQVLYWRSALVPSNNQ
ncbi:hypothetical protein IGI04_019549, partial [Brassica rapa subsp. trilocularis]